MCQKNISNQLAAGKKLNHFETLLGSVQLVLKNPILVYNSDDEMVVYSFQKEECFLRFVTMLLVPNLKRKYLHILSPTVCLIHGYIPKDLFRS